MTLDLTLEDFFAAKALEQIRKPLYCYLLLSYPFFPPLWHFDIRTEQQYAQAFSPLSPPTVSPLLSTGPFIIQLWGEECGGGDIVARRVLAAEPVSNNDIISAGLAGIEGSLCAHQALSSLHA